MRFQDMYLMRGDLGVLDQIKGGSQGSSSTAENPSLGLFRTMFVPSFDISLHFQNGALRLDVTDKQSITIYKRMPMWHGNVAMQVAQVEFL